MRGLLKVLPLRSHHTLQKRRQKDGKSQGGWRTPREQGLLSPVGLMPTLTQRMWQHAQSLLGLGLSRFQHWEEKWTQAHIPYPEVISTVSCLQLKNWLSLRESHWVTNHSSGQAPCPAVDGQHKMNSMTFSEMFCVIMYNSLVSVCWFHAMHYPFSPSIPLLELKPPRFFHTQQKAENLNSLNLCCFRKPNYSKHLKSD